jgi:hypothetical protein
MYASDRCPTWEREPTPVQMALARGHRWVRDAGVRRGKVTAGACQEGGVYSSYVSRMVNLTTIPPDIAAAVLEETCRRTFTLFDQQPLSAPLGTRGKG